MRAGGLGSSGPTNVLVAYPAPERHVDDARVAGVNRVYSITVNCDGTLGTVQVAVTGVR